MSRLVRESEARTRKVEATRETSGFVTTRRREEKRQRVFHTGVEQTHVRDKRGGNGNAFRTVSENTYETEEERRRGGERGRGEREEEGSERRRKRRRG